MHDKTPTSPPAPYPLNSSRSFLRESWPWFLLLIPLGIAVWHLLYFPDGIDGEFPGVKRPTFSRYPPPAYRLAEPGDTIDRVSLYLGAVAMGLSLIGIIRSALLRDRQAILGWIAGLLMLSVITWHFTNPWPTFDGWHGWGWRVVLLNEAPTRLRVILLVSALGIGTALLLIGRLFLKRWRTSLRTLAERRTIGLLLLGTISTALGVSRIVDVEPFGYWPRWMTVIGLLAVIAALIRNLPDRPRPIVARLLPDVAGMLATVGLISVGLTVFWYHRPLDRLREIVPGKVFISAMPTKEGLEVAQKRHHFRTIINLFQEDLPGLRSPHLDEELSFVRERGLSYIGSPAEPSKAGEFLDTTLETAIDPEAWPVLLHCHACMDRTPAWWGIYSFLVEGKPLRGVMQQIEQHRGYRPKASVTLLYNRVLNERAPEQYKNDPTAKILKEAAVGVPDPFLEALARERAAARRSEDHRTTQ